MQLCSWKQHFVHVLDDLVSSDAFSPAALGVKFTIARFEYSEAAFAEPVIGALLPGVLSSADFGRAAVADRPPVASGLQRHMSKDDGR